MKYLEKLEQDLVPMKELLARSLTEIEMDIHVHEENLKELRSARTRLTGLMRQIDPSSQPKRNGRPQMNVSEDSVEKLLYYLTVNKDRLNEEGFYAKGLIQDPDFAALKNISTVSRSLLVLHQRELITLVGRGRGGKRVYKVV